MHSLKKMLSIFVSHDDVIKWKHFPRYWPFVRGIHRWRGALMFSLTWTNAWVNNLDWWFETPSHSLWRHCNESNLPQLTPTYRVIAICCALRRSTAHEFCLRLGRRQETIFETLQCRHMSVMASQVTGNSSVCSTVGLTTNKHQHPALLDLGARIHRWQKLVLWKVYVMTSS